MSQVVQQEALTRLLVEKGVSTKEEFKKYYDEKVRNYSNSLSDYNNADYNNAKDEHWICWDEFDLMVQIGRFFYKQIEKEPDYQKIELHFDKKISLTNFGDYDFKGRLSELKEKLGRTPKVDLTITQEDNFGPFLLCAEAKHFHYAVERGKRTIESEIDKDIQTLKTIKNLGIVERVVFILFDDHYYLHEKKKLEKMSELHGIKVLYHDTYAKIREWNELK